MIDLTSPQKYKNYINITFLKKISFFFFLSESYKNIFKHFIGRCFLVKDTIFVIPFDRKFRISQSKQVRVKRLTEKLNKVRSQKTAMDLAAFPVATLGDV